MSNLTIEILKENIEVATQNLASAKKSHDSRVKSHGWGNRSAVSLRNIMKACIKAIAENTEKLEAELAKEPQGVKTYGYDAYKMSKNLTVNQLEVMLEQVRKEHTKKNKDAGDIYLLDKKGVWKSDQITWAIYYITKKAA